MRAGDVADERDWIAPAALVGVALAIRLALAFVVQAYVDRKGTLCVFGDTDFYWSLAGSILKGEPFRVIQPGGPHYALRTPGYPSFLAACRLLFGDSVLAVRIVQAVLNAGSVLLVAALAREVSGGDRRGAVAAALLSALDPYAAGMSVLILSEGTFTPLMLLGMLGLAKLWRPKEAAPLPAPRRRAWAAATGLAMGLAIQTRPSWALSVPVLLAVWAAARGRKAWGEAAVVALVVGAVMAPWWVRNARVFGRFVPTAMWVGASLYDGLSPTATGASDMRFLNAPDVAALGEEAQDAELKARSTAFVKSDPAAALRLAVVKAGRYFSPWPNADSLRSVPAAIASAVATIPVFVLCLLGAWDRRRDGRALVLSFGPLVYFLLLHMVFVSSIRYRIPGMQPAHGPAGAALARLWSARRTGRGNG